jgi:hypothetical protein
VDPVADERITIECYGLGAVKSMSEGVHPNMIAPTGLAGRPMATMFVR